MNTKIFRLLSFLGYLILFFGYFVVLFVNLYFAPEIYAKLGETRHLILSLFLATALPAMLCTLIWRVRKLERDSTVF